MLADEFKINIEYSKANNILFNSYPNSMISLTFKNQRTDSE